MHFFNGSSLYSSKPTGKVKVSDKALRVEEGADIQKLMPSSGGWGSVYDKTLSSDKKIQLAEIELSDGKETWWASSLGKDVYAIFIGTAKNIDNIVLIPTGNIFEIKESEKTPEKSQINLYTKGEIVSTSDFYVTGNSVNVRDKPSSSGKSIAKLNKGDAVKLVGSESVPTTDYAKIVWKSKSANKSGYISTKYISASKPALTKSESSVAKTAPSKSNVKPTDLQVTDEVESESSNMPLIVGGSLVAGIGIFLLLKKKGII